MLLPIASFASMPVCIAPSNAVRNAGWGRHLANRNSFTRVKSRSNKYDNLEKGGRNLQTAGQKTGSLRNGN
jgi:hypothetical protein